MARAENILFNVENFKLEIPFFEFPDSGITAIWGASGSGKSTLLQILAGLIESPHFKLVVGGEDLSRLPTAQRNCGFVFQDFKLFPHLTVLQNISFATEARGIPKKIWGPLADEMIDELNLRRCLSQKTSTLSGGEQQRTAIARALITNPKLVLMDEPLSSLDEKLKDSARSMIQKLSKKFRVPFIIVTHDMRDVRYLSEHLLILSHGKCLGYGLTSNCLNRPEHLEMAKAIPENIFLNVSDVKKDNGKVSFLLSGTSLTIPEKNVFATSDTKPQVMVKKWAFELVLIKSYSPSFIHVSSVVESHDAGLHREGTVLLSDGQNAPFRSKLDAIELQQISSLVLIVDETTLLLFTS